MAYIVAGLTKGAHQARGLIRALADAGFPREEIDMAGGPIAALVEMGIPENEAHVFAEGARRGAATSCNGAHSRALTLSRTSRAPI